jgi:type I restriction enzyme R subunit
MRNEADTRATLIDPKLKAAGWTDTQVTREHYYQRDHQYTQGRVILVGDRVRRGDSRKVDYLLRLSDAFPIAVVEAKAESEPAEAGLEQAKRYARDLGLAFAYATNGHQIIEFDFFTNSSREIGQFPSPQELWDRWWRNAGPVHTRRVAEPPTAYGAAKRESPLLHPYCPEAACGKKPFYFQEVAIREVVKRLMLGRKRVLLPMATGTGKTFVAFQVVWKLVKSGWLQRCHPERPGRVLFLADRVVLRDQAYNTFAPFADGTSEPRFKIEGHPPNPTRDRYFGIYQALCSPDDTGRRLFEKFPADFFDLVIIDECHRSGFGTWREILDHFGSAIHLPEAWPDGQALPRLKKFSKGSPIQDEHFKEARELSKAWDAHRKGRGPREACLSERSWVVPAEEIRARGYDLTARNPNRKETEALPSPMEIVASLLEREREILSIVEELDELLGNSEGEM